MSPDPLSAVASLLSDGAFVAQIRVLALLLIAIGAFAITIFLRSATRTFAIRASWDLEATFYDLSNDNYLCEVAIVIRNIGQVRMNVKRLTLQVRGRMETVEIEQLEFDKEIYDKVFSEWVLPRQAGSPMNIVLDEPGGFVEPGVTEKFTYIFPVKRKHSLLEFHSRFEYPRYRFLIDVLPHYQKTNIRRLIQTRDSAHNRSLETDT